MEIKNQCNKMINKNSEFNNKGDVINGDKYVLNYINNQVSFDEIYKELTCDLKNNYSEFYKRYILQFKELENYTISFLYSNYNESKFEFTSIPLVFGKKIINWIYGLEEFPCVEIEKFYIYLKEQFDFNNDTFIVKRWNANIPYFKENLKVAIENYKKLLNEIVNINNIPSWYIDDICIDGRNILIENANINNMYEDILNDEFQKKIDSNKHKLSYPDVDRIKSEIFDDLSKTIFSNKNKSKYTTIYGIGLKEFFNQIQNLIFLSVFYGSITHLKLVRKLISNVMYMYADTFEDEEFYKITLRMLFLSGEFKKYRNLYDKIKLNFRFVNNNEFILEIFRTKKILTDFDQIKSDIFLFDIYGKYMDDNSYEKMETKILDIVKINDKYNIAIADIAVKSIKSNIKRFKNIENLFEIIDSYFVKEYSRFYMDIISIVNDIDVKELSEKNFILYQKIIDNLIINKARFSLDISDCIVKIKERDLKITKYDTILEDINSNENILYESEIKKNQLKAIKRIIEIYKKRHESREKNPSTLIGYSYDYTIGIGIFSKTKYKGEIKDFIQKSYIPLAIDILNSENEILYEKVKNLKLLAHILIVEKDEIIRNKIIDCIDNLMNKKYNSAHESWQINYKNKVDLEINIIMCKTIIGKENLNDILDRYIEIAISNPENIEEILNCIEILTKYVKNKKTIEKLYILFCMCFSINDSSIRNKIIFISKIFLNTKYEKKIIKKLEDRAENITYEESIGFINLMKSISKKNKRLFNNINNKLKNNRNYYIRYITKKYLKLY